MPELVNAVKGKLKVDAYVVPSDGPFPSEPARKNMSFKTVSEYMDGYLGNYYMEFRNSATGRMIARSDAVDLGNKQIRTVVLAGSEEGFAVLILLDRKG